MAWHTKVKGNGTRDSLSLTTTWLQLIRALVYILPKKLLNGFQPFSHSLRFLSSNDCQVNTDSRLCYHVAQGCSPVEYFTLLRWPLEELIFSAARDFWTLVKQCVKRCRLWLTCRRATYANVQPAAISIARCSDWNANQGHGSGVFIPSSLYMLYTWIIEYSCSAQLAIPRKTVM